jgi:hypothetical protein
MLTELQSETNSGGMLMIATWKYVQGVQRLSTPHIRAQEFLKSVMQLRKQSWAVLTHFGRCLLLEPREHSRLSDVMLSATVM